VRDGRPVPAGHGDTLRQGRGSTGSLASAGCPWVYPRYTAPLSAMLPGALLPVTGVRALVLVWPRLRTQPSNGRLFAEAFGTALVSICIVWAARVLHW
jgi:hypothetical protein